ncbi:CaiB/BaiF CoA-transferase family protein [Sphingomonas sp. C3-2]|uniref:CaiB/BaiF CoA transferase family protein n=1 Tax=Sphingomonas sp. C3-2 TaxID=3062169 RepID=UPI00294AB349|nr:CaiB/BaiF CoA-transferase family protein [Sphingomonas sp. C3-2]WOK37210.1 CaiB/BaiF CoA-transferase family protein [Sphingomonas sp. C3-2]
MNESVGACGPLAGIRVLDLSRVLAGPWATQVLGDLGAEVLKIEQPGKGDDTRHWGPPFLDDGSGDAAYYLAINRNKRSLEIDIAKPEGAEIIRKLALESDIVVENFRVGGLAKYGLDYASLARLKPDLIYCSVTGFGQDGPYADRGGYDFLVQGMSGLMSVTGRPDGEPGAGPMKVGVPVADLFTGLNATIAILAALRHRDATGQGQHIDCALLDSQVAMLANQASNWLNGGVTPGRLGNDHPNVIPYRDFRTADGNVLVALGNDRQFFRFCKLIGRDDLAEDARFGSNAARAANRPALMAALEETIVHWTSAELIAAMEAEGLPGGPVNTIPQIFADPQIAARGVVQTMTRDTGVRVQVPGFPPRLSASPASYRTAPPRLGADTETVLAERLGLGAGDMESLRQAGVIGGSQVEKAS